MSTQETASFIFTPPTIPNSIYVVGCGGTGSRLVPPLVQFIRSIMREFNPRGWIGNAINIVLCDGDIVEEKNLLRQNFVPSDLGKNKASVLANRYSKAYGVPIIAYPSFVRPEVFSRNELPGYVSASTQQDMVIMCVDSANARREVLKALRSTRAATTTFVIDAGNEDTFGQVKFFTNSCLVAFPGAEQANPTIFKKPEKVVYLQNVAYLPYDQRFYETLEDIPGQGSCADLDQTLAINSLMATMILSIVQNYYYSTTMDYNGWFIDIAKGLSGYYKNTLLDFKQKMVEGYGYDYGRGQAERGSFQATCLIRSAEDTFIDYHELNSRAIHDEAQRKIEEGVPTLGKKAAEVKAEVEVESMPAQEGVVADME